MIGFAIDIDDTEVRAAFDDWPRKIPRLHNMVLRRIGERCVGNAKQYWLTGQSLHVRTGKMRNTVTYKMDGNFMVIVGSNAPQGAIHEFGGVILPRRAKYLAIPMNAQAEGKSPRAFPDLFPIRSKDGRLFLARRPMFIARRKANTGGAVVFMYALKRSVTMPRRPWLSPAIHYTFESGQAQDIATRTTREFITAEWGKN
jgi:hypothetical protein